MGIFISEMTVSESNSRFAFIPCNSWQWSWFFTNPKSNQFSSFGVCNHVSYIRSIYKPGEEFKSQKSAEYSSQNKLRWMDIFLPWSVIEFPHEFLCKIRDTKRHHTSHTTHHKPHTTHQTPHTTPRTTQINILDTYYCGYLVRSLMSFLIWKQSWLMKICKIDCISPFK